MNKKSLALKISYVSLMAAAIECGKLVLASIPNIEVVTLLIAIFSYSFGSLGFAATLIFVSIEPLIWGFGTWVISYFIYWPMLSLLFVLYKKIGSCGVILSTVSATIMTIFFGILTSLVEVGLFTGGFDNFWYRFGVYYARGLSFYIAQIITNLVVFPVLFVPLTRAIRRFSIK